MQKKLREKIGHGTMQAISSESNRGYGSYHKSSDGFGKKMEGFGAGSHSKERTSGQYGGYNSKDTTSEGFGNYGGYDDVKKVSSWRTAGKQEGKSKPEEKIKEHHHQDETKKPKASVSGGETGLKPIPSPADIKKEQQKTPINLFDKEENDDGFDWNKASEATQKKQTDEEWSWEQAEIDAKQLGKNQLTNQQQSSTQQQTGQKIADWWGETPTTHPTQTNQFKPTGSGTIDINSLYQGVNLQQPATQGARLSALDQAFQPQPQFIHSQYQQQAAQQYPIGQFQQMNIRINTETQNPFQSIQQPKAGFNQVNLTHTDSQNFNQFDFVSKTQQSGFDFQNNLQTSQPVKNMPPTQKQTYKEDEGFEDFQTAETKKNSMFTGVESGLIDLGDLSKEAAAGGKQRNTQQENNQTAFQLYSTKDDLDRIFDNPPVGFNLGGPGASMGFGGQQQGGYGANAGFGPNTGFTTNTFNSGMNQGLLTNQGFNSNGGYSVNQGFQAYGYGNNGNYQGGFGGFK